jgi:hypothetical protein
MPGNCVSIDSSATFSRQQRSLEIDREKGNAVPAYRWDRRLQKAHANERKSK